MSRTGATKLNLGSKYGGYMDNREYSVIMYDNMYHDAILSATRSSQTMAIVRTTTLLTRLASSDVTCSQPREAECVGPPTWRFENSTEEGETKSYPRVGSEGGGQAYFWGTSRCTAGCSL